MKFPAPAPAAAWWSLDPKICFLNHGSFGATPKALLQKQQAYRDQMEAEPVRFMVRELEELLWQSKTRLGKFMGTAPEDLVFVPNATTGVNTVLSSMQWEPGDAVLTTNHAYGACYNALEFFARQKKLEFQVADVPYPISQEDEVTDAILGACTPKTRLAMIDHITSATGIVFPIQKIVRALQARGIQVLVDGAHTPGMLPVQLDELGADYFTGNCHKWICSPKGSAFLQVRKDRQELVRPMGVSHTYDEPVPAARLWSSHFMWPGTGDFTAYLTVADAIHYFEQQVEGGWAALQQRSHTLCLEARQMLSRRTGYSLPAPEHMIAQLSNLALGETSLPPYGFNYIHPVQEILFRRYGIEVPVFLWNKAAPRLWLRISVQLYNSMEQYEYLANALCELKAAGEI